MERVPLALAHDYLTQRGGAERVVAAWTQFAPTAPLFTSLYEPNTTFDEFASVDVRSGRLNRIPYFRHHHRAALPFLASATSATTITADITLASSSGWAHGVTASDYLAVYCHAPARWLYQTDRYLRRGGLSPAAQLSRMLFKQLRGWDEAAQRRADLYVVNSSVTQTLVQEVYGRSTSIVAPPVDIPSAMPVGDARGDVLVVARLLPYKNVDLALEVARSMPDVRFRIIGDGPLRDALRQLAPPNVTLLGAVSDGELWLEYTSTQVHLALSHEDFGITPLEAAAAGKPTVARRSGGYLDTITANTGILIDEKELTVSTIVESLEQSLVRAWDEHQLRHHAQQFSREAHWAALRSAVPGL
jgi:glycosyltransferase involved in cell wall biosynthesis